MSALKLYFLGTPRIELAGQPVAMDTRKAVAMLAYLALSGERQTRDSLAALLWSEFDDARAKAALRRTLSTLKTAVTAHNLSISREAIGLRDAIGLEADGVWCDVVQFQMAVQNGDLETAVSLYRDDFLTGFSLRDSIPFDDWQLIQVEALRRDMASALELLCQQQQAAGQFTAAITTAHRWLTFDPLREEAHRLLMLLYTQAGQRNNALNQYRACVRILDKELGVAPLPQTVELYEAIRNNQISPIPDADDPPVAPPALQKQEMLFVGRQPELAQMHQLYKQVGANGRLLIIEGEAGIGKTMLAHTFLAHCQAQSAVTLAVRCYEGESNLAYAAISQLLHEGLNLPGAAAQLETVPPHFLAEVGRLLPEIEAWQSTPIPLADLDSPGAQNRFYEGVGQVLQALLHGEKPGVLFWDDVHWLDSASLELLLFLLRRWRKRPFLMLLCWRSDALPANHALLRLAAEMRRDGVSEQLALTRFSAEEVAALLTAVMPIHASNLPLKLYEETEGLPYFLVEYLQALVEQILPADLDASWDIPRTVRDLLVSRLAQVDEAEHQLLQTAATIGHAFNYDLLRLVSGRSDEEMVLALEKLVARGLFNEQSTPSASAQAVYDFSHTKLYELAYAEMGLARRRLLHRRVAEALAQSNRRQFQTTAVTAEIANHYRQASLDEEAATYFVKAGDQAKSLFAHQEAIYYYQSALALGYADVGPLHEACADLYIRLGDYASALVSYETAASQLDVADLGRLEHKIAQVYMRQGFWQKAEAQLLAAKEQISQPDDLVRLYIDWSYVAFNLKDFEQAKTYAAQGQKLATSPQAQAQCHNISGILARQEGAFAEAMAHFSQSVALAQANKLPDTEIASLNNLALAETAVAQFNLAQQHLTTALSRCIQYGDRHREAALHNNLADLYHQMGDEASSMAELKTAVAIYAEIGGNPGSWQPEIWKLTEW